MAGSEKDSTATRAARTAETTLVTGGAARRDHALTTFYDRYSAVGLGRLRRLLNDTLAGHRRAGPPRARRYMGANIHAAAATTPVHLIPTVTETNDSDHDHPGIIDHSRHVSSIGRR